MEQEDSKSEEEKSMKWRDYAIETFITICREMEQQFAKLEETRCENT